MLFSYTPLDNVHNIEKLDLYFNYFFENLFQNEPQDISLLIHQDFCEIYNAHHTAIKERLQNIHQSYLTLDVNEKETIQEAFYNNKQIENICNGTINPIKYEQLPDSIKDILKSLYNTSWTLLTNKNDETNRTIKDRCGNIYEHYCNLFQEDRQIFTICPVCGLEELLGEYESCDNPNEENQKKVREAYDHYFPKALYPFISVNFNNLIPICHHCNSDYKHEYDTAYNHENNLRQECFYPFSAEANNISISIIDAQDTIRLASSNDWDIQATPLNEKVSSWDRIFDIKSRYKTRIKTKEKAWKERLVDAIRNKPTHLSWDEYKSFLYKDIKLRDQSSAIVQKAYYDYFFENLLDGYLEEVA